MMLIIWHTLLSFVVFTYFFLSITGMHQLHLWIQQEVELPKYTTLNVIFLWMPQVLQSNVSLAHDTSSLLHHSQPEPIDCHVDEHTHPSSHTPYAGLHTPRKNERLHSLHSEARKFKQKMEYLRQKITASVESNPADVDRELDDDLQQIIVESQNDVHATNPEGSFQWIYWEEQQASALPDWHSMKCLPLFIKWCLYLRHVSRPLNLGVTFVVWQAHSMTSCTMT